MGPGPDLDHGASCRPNSTQDMWAVAVAPMVVEPAWGSLVAVWGSVGARVAQGPMTLGMGAMHGPAMLGVQGLVGTGGRSAGSSNSHAQQGKGPNFQRPLVAWWAG